MRKHLLLVLLTVLCCNGLFAQEESMGDKSFRIALGPKAGVGIDMGSHSKLENLDFGMGFGYQFGAAFNAHFGRRNEWSQGGTGWFGLQVEALYGSRTIRLGTIGLKTNCIEVPVMAQFYVTEDLALQVGATAVMILRTLPDQLTYNSSTYGTGEIKGKDIMITAGLAYKARLKDHSALLVDARYNMGMSPLAGNFDTKVSSAMVSLSYLFNIVK